MKKILPGVIAALLLVMVLPVNAFAFGGYAHWDIAGRAVVANNIPTTNNYSNAYMSGVLLADIGKYSWDNDYTVSDSNTFANKMISIVAPNMQGTYFARGWLSHVYQDNYGNVAAILDDGDNYRVNCGQIDEYLRDDLKINCPINGTANLYVVYEMIRNTYAALDGFSPTNAEIDKQIKNMYFLYHVQILLNFSGMSEKQIKRLNDQFDDLAENCYSTNASSSTSSSQNVVLSSMDLIQRERSNPAKYESLEAIVDSVTEYAYLETVSEENGVTELRYVITDYEAYEDLAEQYVSLIMKDTESDISRQ